MDSNEFEVGSRALDFFAVIVLDKATLGSGSEKGHVLYQHTFSRNECHIAQGLEMFCQPLGWKLSPVLIKPQFIPFALTAENGARTYCCGLVYYQQHNGSSASVRDKMLSSLPAAVSPLDEGNEVFFKDSGNGAALYEPVSLCLLSSLPMYHVLKRCLLYVYTSWIEQQHFQLEQCLEALSRLHVPLLGNPEKVVHLSPLVAVHLPPYHADRSLPFTTTEAVSLLKTIGVQNFLSLFAAILSEVSILFKSWSYVRLVNAQMALLSVIHPLELGYSFVPVVPQALLDFLDLPSTYIMGIHSSCASAVGSLGDTILVDLDGGTISVPDSASLLLFPEWISAPITKALKQVLDSGYYVEDFAFDYGQNEEPEEFVDKQVRAIFLSLNALLTGDLQEYMTVLRFHPQPTFYFDKKKFLAKYVNTHEAFFQRLCDSLAFANFVLQRANPFRACDYFDELLAKLLDSKLLNPEYVFSSAHTKAVAQELLKKMPCCVKDQPWLSWHQWFEDRSPLYGQKQFPIPKENSVSEGNKNFIIDQDEVLMKVPFVKFQRSGDAHKSTVETDRIVTLRKFLKHLFKGELLEARKYIHTIEEYIRHRNFQDVFIRDLIGNLTMYGGSMTREQYDVFARVFNTAVLVQEMAARVLPLLSIIRYKISSNLSQELVTSVQGHFVWEDIEFWKTVLFAGVEAELIRMYTPGTTGNEAAPDPVMMKFGDISPVMKPAAQRTSLKDTLKRSLPRGAQLRVINSQTKLPKSSEGLPAYGQPHPTGYCLMCLAECMPELPYLPADIRQNCEVEEQNAIFNQIFQCISRIIELRCPVGIVYEGPEKDKFVSILTDWIFRFVRSVEVDLQLQERLSNRIVSMVKEQVSFRLESIKALSAQESVTASSPSVIILRPPFLKGETLKKVVHAYLLPDGNNPSGVLPAEGHLFLTAYRIIFLGTPCNRGSQNEVVIRSTPLYSLFKWKEVTSYAFPFDDRNITVNKVVQLRSLTCQLMRVGFEDANGASSLISQMIHLRYPKKDVMVAIPLKRLAKSGEQQKKKPTLRRTKSKHQAFEIEASLISSLAQSCYCKEYSRLQLGTVNVKGSGTGLWRASKLNLDYSVCNSYPCVVAVPELLSDQTLSAVAPQFVEQRFPAATWRSVSTGATLLRSGGFKYKLPKQTATVASSHDGVAKEEKKVYGVFSAEVESLIKSIISITPGSSASVQDSLVKGVETKYSASAYMYQTTSSDDEIEEENVDLEVNNSPDVLPPGISERNSVAFEIAETAESKEGLDQKLESSPSPVPVPTDEDRQSAGLKFSSIPTNPLDWVTVDLLPDAIRMWKHSPLYVIGDKERIKHIPKDLYSGCTFVPVEVQDLQSVRRSFKKLSRACCPSSQKHQHSSFLSDVSSSHWLDHLSSLLQLSVAVADLIHIQGSSVLIALEKGMDVTSQVVSLAQLMLDPFYRTIEGFKHLLEKDWLAFGHPFSRRSNQVLDTSLKHDLSPVFLQFLDCAHQILTQCPAAFEFNDCFLKTIAFHCSSSRFHTFFHNCEKARIEDGWCEYLVQGLPDGEELSSFWDYISTVDNNLPVFFNPFYSGRSHPDVLLLQTYQANLDVWSFYTEDSLSRFPMYDFELYTCANLTVQDIQNETKFFNTAVVKPLSPTDVATNYLELSLMKCTDLLQSVDPTKTWRDLWGELSEGLVPAYPPLAHRTAPEPPESREMNVVHQHNHSLHRQTSLAVLMKTHLSVELKDNLNKPHCFIPYTSKGSLVCEFCKHKIITKQAHKCTLCSKFCHGYCKQLIPHNCGVKTYGNYCDSASIGVEDAFRMRQGSSTFYVKSDQASHIYEGHLFKKGYFVKNWKQRWFVLDSDKKELCYYDPKDDDRCLGVIAIKDVTNIIKSGEFPVSVLASGSVGFMFDVATGKRTYHLMAQDDVSRVSWILRLNKAREANII